jgi:rhomboid protease GluP
MQEPPRPVVVQPPPPPSLWDRVRVAPVTIGLAAVNVCVFVLAWRWDSSLENVTLLRFGAVKQSMVSFGEWWRIGTCMFMHISWMHLLWNTYASFGWCAPVERALGGQRFLVVYLLSGIGGGCASALCHDVTAAGASGACFGIVGATLVLVRRRAPSWEVFFKLPGVRSTLISAGIWTVIGVTLVNMDNFAHGGGFVTGIVVTTMVTSRTAAWRSPLLALPMAAAMFVVGARPWHKPTPKEADEVAVYGEDLRERGDTERGTSYIERAGRLAP